MKISKWRMVLGKRVLAVVGVFLVLVCGGAAYQGMPIRPLQVVGRYLKDDTGKIVILHGWMQPSGWYWNGFTFQDPIEYTPEECAPALRIYKLQVDMLTSTNPVWGKSHGSYHTFVRFGESPGWDPVNNLQNADRFERYITNLLVPYIEYCAQRGVYVCFIGGASTTNWMCAQHKANLIEYFRRLAGHPAIKNRPNVMFEICNEPVDIESELGNDDWGSSQEKYDIAMQRFMQDIADAIRSTGATNVIWIPGQVWQARLQNFARYPIHGVNIGYAGHWYPIGEDNPTNILQGYTNDWKKCADVAPIIVTEGSWNTMAEDQGLRRGTTEGFGKTQRFIRDTAENISWMAGMNGEVIGNLEWNPNTNTWGFPTVACGQAAFDWWPSYTWCAPSSIGTETVLEQSLKVGDKLEVRNGLAVAQSFKYGPVPGGPNFQITKLRVFLSKSPAPPTANLVISLGTLPNGGTIPGTTVTIAPGQVTDSSGGTTFMTYDIAYPTPIGPLAAGTTYYINFSSESVNPYFVQISSLADSHTGTIDDLYPRGAALTNGVDTGRDVRFLIFGSDLPTVPWAPTGLTATPIAENKVRLSWVDSRLAAGYNIKRATASGGPYVTIVSNWLKNHYVDTGLINGMTYYYVVSAVNHAGESTNSVQVSVSPEARLTGVVIGSPGSWNNSGNTKEKVFDGDLETFYDAVRGSGDWAGLDLGAPRVISRIGYCPRRGFASRMVNGRFEAANVPDFSSGVVTLLTITTAPAEGVLTIRTISNPNPFRYVRYIGPANGYCNIAEAVFWSTNTGATPPAPPTGLSVTLSNRVAVLTWNASSGAAAYRVKRSTTSGGPYVVLTNLTGTSFVDTTLPTNTLYTWRYYYVVSAVNHSGEGPDSPQVGITMPPAAPGRVTASLDLWQTRLWWDFPGGADTYNVKRSTKSGGPYSLIASNLVNNNFTDPELWNGTNYYYVVSAVNAGGEGPDSVEVTLNPPYPWMTREIGGGGGSAWFSNGVFTVSGSGADIWGSSDQFRFVYTPITGNCYIVARVVSLENIDPWSKAGVMIRASLAPNSAHAFVAVTPSNGVAFQWRTTTGGNSYNNNTPGLQAPYWVRLVRTGNTFTAYRSPDGINWTQQGSSQTISMPSVVYVGLAVTAHNVSQGCTAFFDNVAVPGWPPVVEPPGAPTGLVATPVSSIQINLGWNTVSNATGYNVKRSFARGGPYTVIASGLSGTNYCDYGLQPGVSCYYVVSAVNSGGEGPNSAEAGATTLPVQLGALVHRYSFNEAGGTVVVDSVGGAVWNGTLPNGGTLSGGTVKLVGASQQYVQLPAGIGSTLSNFTFEAWVRLNSVANWVRIFDFGNDMTVNMFLTPQNSVNGRVRFAITTGGAGAEERIDGTFGLVAGSWYHVAVVVDGNVGVLYVNGEAVGTNSSISLRPVVLGVTTNNWLGRSQYSWDPYLDGEIDEFRIYCVALSAGELAASYALGPDRLLSGSAPVLGVRVVGDGLEISWPVECAGYRLQWRTNLVVGEWLNYTSSVPRIVEGEWRVSVPVMEEPCVFYRLVK